MILQSTGPVAEILEMPGKSQGDALPDRFFKNARISRIVIFCNFAILENLQNLKVQILRFGVAKILGGQLLEG